MVTALDPAKNPAVTHPPHPHRLRAGRAQALPDPLGESRAAPRRGQDARVSPAAGDSLQPPVRPPEAIDDFYTRQRG